MARFISEKVKRDINIAKEAKALLKQHNKKHTKKTSKKLDHEQLLKITPNITKIKDFWIRNPEEWISKSFNLERQIIDFASWLLCEYPVPLFMYKIFMPPPKNRRWSTSKPPLEEIYLDWFITIGQGMSFRKASKNLLSKKEAYLFLTAPKNNSIAGNILWAKCKSFGASSIVTNLLCTTWANRLTITNRDQWDKIINFYSRYPHVDRPTVQDTLDFIYDTFGRNKNFSLSNRTLNSIVQLSNEWHHEQQLCKGIGFSSWNGLPIPDWKWDVTGDDMDVWYISQILNSNKLLHEGRVMKHCVGAYSSYCASGYTGIFTVDHTYCGVKSKVLTIEVNSSFKIVQARGKRNKQPDKEEIKIIHKWASDIGLTYQFY